MIVSQGNIGVIKMKELIKEIRKKWVNKFTGMLGGVFVEEFLADLNTLEAKMDEFIKSVNEATEKEE